MSEEAIGTNFWDNGTESNRAQERPPIEDGEIQPMLEEWQSPTNNRLEGIVSGEQIIGCKSKEQELVTSVCEEFVCVICQEMFINATTLPCAHTFCDHCIRGWMKRQKTCPICRRSMVVGKAVRSYALESAIEKIVDASMNPGYKQIREATKLEREVESRGDSERGDNLKYYIQNPNYESPEETRERSRSRARPPVRQQGRWRRFHSRSGPYQHRGNNYNNLHRGNNYGEAHRRNNYGEAHIGNNYGNPSGSNQHWHPLASGQQSQQPQPQGELHYNLQPERRCFVCGDPTHIARDCNRSGPQQQQPGN